MKHLLPLAVLSVLLITSCADGLFSTIGELYIVDDPVLSPLPGQYSEDIEVVLRTATSGAEIWYTTDGSDPVPDNPEAKTYTEPLIWGSSHPDWSVGNNLKLFIRAYRANMSPSEEIIAIYGVNYPKPSDPVLRVLPGTSVQAADGTWSGEVQIQVEGDSWNDEAERLWKSREGLSPRIYWTSDGTLPTVANNRGNLSNGTTILPVTLRNDGTDAVINARTIVGSPYEPSPVTTLRVRIRFTDRVENPVFTNNDDEHLSSALSRSTVVKVSTATPNAVITVERQVNGGSWQTVVPESPFDPPDTSSEAHITVFQNAQAGDVVNLRAQAGDVTDWGDSEWVTASYTFVPGVVEKPDVSPPSGSYVGSVDLVFSVDGSTEGRFLFTLDGSPPTSENGITTNPFPLAAPGTFYINAVKEENGQTSAVSSVIIEILEALP